MCAYLRWVENWGYTIYKMKHLRILKGTILIRHLKTIFMSAHIYLLLKGSQAAFLVVIFFIFLEDEPFFQHYFSKTKLTWKQVFDVTTRGHQVLFQAVTLSRHIDEYSQTASVQAFGV